MKYEGTVYRPPSEAYSLIIQATIGCSHNKCTFCSMFKDKKFRIRKCEDIVHDLITSREDYLKVERIFLADGNALMMKMEDIRKILLTIKQLFPECKRVGIYAAPNDILRKSLDELKEMKSLGLGIVYLGLESGSEEILKAIKKGATPEDMINAARKVKESGLKLSVTLISGLGGREKWHEHAARSAEVLSKMDPDYLGTLTLLIEPNTEMYNEVKSGRFELLNPKEIMAETLELIENLELTNCVFRSNHISNYVSLGGILPADKEKLLEEIKYAAKGEYEYRDDSYRTL